MCCDGRYVERDITVSNRERISMKSQEELSKTVLERSGEVNGRRTLTCAQALALATELGVEPIHIGRICNQEKIRLGGCQLGCFS